MAIEGDNSSRRLKRGSSGSGEVKDVLRVIIGRSLSKGESETESKTRSQHHAAGL